MKENDFTLKKARGRRYRAETMTYVNYADDIALLENKPTRGETLLHCLE